MDRPLPSGSSVSTPGIGLIEVANNRRDELLTPGETGEGVAVIGVVELELEAELPLPPPQPASRLEPANKANAA